MVAGVCAEDGKGFPVHVGIPQTAGLDDGSDPNQSINQSTNGSKWSEIKMLSIYLLDLTHFLGTIKQDRNSN